MLFMVEILRSWRTGMVSQCHTLYAKVYYGLRFLAHRNRRVLRWVQSFRAYLVLGPLRKLFIWYYQKYSKNVPFITDASRILPLINTERIVNTLEEAGYAHVGTLPQELVNEILAYCDAHKRIRYVNPHRDCDAIYRLCRNADIVGIARQYLGTEPILWLTRLRWSIPASDGGADLQPSVHRDPVDYDPHGFHYDTNDFKSLTFFTYLTDIDELDSGAHVVVEGSHKNKTFWEIKNKVLDDDVVYRTYSKRVRTILGKKGTMFVEETSTYHKIAACKQRRLILIIDYVLARKVPPEPPLTFHRNMGPSTEGVV